MRHETFKFAFLFFILMMFGNIGLASASVEDASDYGPKFEKEFDSMEKWENWLVKKDARATSHTCEGKIIWDASELDNTYIPTAMGQNMETSPNGTHDGRTINQIATVATVLAAGGGALVLIAAAGAQYAVMTDTCASNYVLAPHEYINRELGKKCNGGLSAGKNITWDAGAFGKADIPFYFHCDPTWDPVSKDKIDINDNENNHLIGRTMGYAGAASSYCNDSRLSGKFDKIKSRVNTITVEQSTWFERAFNTGDWEVCEEGRETTGEMTPGGDAKWAGIIRFQAYYALSDGGKVQICAAAPDMFFPLRIGCTATAAPGDETNIDDYLRNYVSDTRCAYLIYPRADLNSLGRALPGGDSNPVKKFLISDLHLTSTVVGCLKDMLVKIFMKTPNASGYGAKPFFQTFQERMHQIVMAALVLYVVIIGLKIMTAGKPPQRHEAVMYVVKFALVVYFAIGGGLYEVKEGELTGLFPNLIQIPDELSDIFLQAQNINDPGGYCFLAYKGKNILSEREINKGELLKVTGTEGTRGNSQYVKMTVWDLVDCKIINYLTLGSCEYTLGGMVSVWFGSASLFVDKIGIMLAIISLLYTIMVLLTMFKFTHIFILAMFTITILIFLSPIFLIFALFDPLKDIFQAWLRMILGYLLYPALLFAFVALMFATFDSIFYGDLNLNEGRSGTGSSIDYEKACAGVDSVFCKLQKHAGWRDNCSGGSISQLLLTTGESEIFGTVTKLSDQVAEDFLDVMLKMLLFAFLFYLFLNSVTEFMSSMLKISGMGGISGMGAIGGPLGQAAAGGAKMAGKAVAAKATGGASMAAGAAAGAAAGGAGKGASAAGGAMKRGGSAVMNKMTGK